MNLKAKETHINLHGYTPAHFSGPSPTPCDWAPALPTSCSQRTRGCLEKDNVITTLPSVEEDLIDWRGSQSSLPDQAK